MKNITAEEFDKKFESDKDILEYCDVESIRQPGLEPKRVNVDFPAWMIDSLDQVARKLGVSRQSLIKFWIAEKLKT